MSEPKRKATPTGTPQWPTRGRIMLYTYERDDFSKAGVGVSRPAIVVDSYESDDGADDPLGELYDVVVFTAGLRDFDRGRPGWDGYISKTGVRLIQTPMPGSISWPPRS